MRYPARQFAERFHLLRLEQCALRLLKQLAGTSSFGNIARNFGKSDQLAILMDGVDHDMREEAASVPPHAPSLGLEPTLTSRRLQAPKGNACCDILWRVEPGKMRADNFLFGVPLDPPCPRVPARDVAIRREHKNGIVGDTLNQQAEAAFAFEHRIVSGLLVADIADHLTETDKLTPAVAQSRHDNVRPECRAILAHAPALGHISPGRGRGLKRRLGHTGGAVHLRIEDRERLSYNFLGTIALDALTARVPSEHSALGREGEDGIILGGFSP